MDTEDWEKSDQVLFSRSTTMAINKSTNTTATGTKKPWRAAKVETQERTRTGPPENGG